MEDKQTTQSTPDDFADAAQKPRIGIAGEFLSFLSHNKKWWLAPIIVILALVGVLLILGSTGAAPFIYTLF